MAILEIILLAFTIFCESLHESVFDKLDVGSTIYNRASDKNYNYIKVIIKPKQFSCYNSFQLINNNIQKIGKQRLQWVISLIIATNIYHNRIKPTVQARHYARIDCNMIWMRNMVIEKQNKNHKYLLEVK